MILSHPEKCRDGGPRPVSGDAPGLANNDDVIDTSSTKDSLDTDVDTDDEGGDVQRDYDAHPLKETFHYSDDMSNRKSSSPNGRGVSPDLASTAPSHHRGVSNARNSALCGVLSFARIVLFCTTQ